MLVFFHLVLFHLSISFFPCVSLHFSCFFFTCVSFHFLFFRFFKGSSQSGRSKITRVTVGRDTDQPELSSL